MLSLFDICGVVFCYLVFVVVVVVVASGVVVVVFVVVVVVSGGGNGSGFCVDYGVLKVVVAIGSSAFLHD